jgi:outer membrane protein OmpA-like peptidoglycan-associated protein
MWWSIVWTMALLHAPSIAFAQIPADAAAERALLDKLNRLGSIHDKLGIVIHRLVVPEGAVTGVASSFSTTRVRYSKVTLFETAKSDLTETAAKAIEGLAKLLKDSPDIKDILVVGHTDSRGSDAYNYDLSVRRAESVAKALIRQGVSPTSISLLGLGEAHPTATNETPEGQALNRRVEFFLASVSGTAIRVVPSVPFDPANRNNHPDDPNAKPGQTDITNFPVRKQDGATGASRETPVKVSVALPPEIGKQIREEFVPRPAIPDDAEPRPDIPN